VLNWRYVLLTNLLSHYTIEYYLTTTFIILDDHIKEEPGDMEFTEECEYSTEYILCYP
jgi:hypothetical protein